jgi:hypothetical protein
MECEPAPSGARTKGTRSDATRDPSMLTSAPAGAVIVTVTSPGLPSRRTAASGVSTSDA